MHRYIAFLRGINVGGRIVRMVELKACLENLGLNNISTLLQSGNISFDSPETDKAALRTKLERTVSSTFNYSAKIFVFTAEEVEMVVRNYPFAPKEGFHSYLVFIDAGAKQPLMSAAMKLPMDPAVEQIAEGKNVVYWQVEKGKTLKTLFAKLLTKAAFKESNTVRNMNTIEKLLA